MATSRSTGRRKSLPAIKLTESAASHDSSHSASSRLKTIPDERYLAVPKRERKTSSLEDLDVKTPHRDNNVHKQRRHSAITLSPRRERTKSPRTTSADTEALTPVDKGRRHSVSGSLGLPKEFHSILKKDTSSEDIIEESEGEAIRQAWLNTGASSSVDIDMPEGSDIFRLAMADFIPEPPPREVTISTVKLKDCSDIDDDEDENDDKHEENDGLGKGCTHVRRIRWSEHVNVIS